jgi:hypothetical protein
MFGRTLTDVRLRRVRPSLTALEQRCVPSVTATFVSGNLAIQGDNGNQTITITETSAATYQVAGLTAGTQTFKGVNYIAVNTMGGADTVNLVGGPAALTDGATISSTGKLTVTNNKFNISTTFGTFTVSDSGPNNVSVFIQAGTVLGKGFNVSTGSGNSSVTLGAGAAVYGPTLLRLGDGTNNVNFNGALVDGALTIAGGSGNDTVTLTNTKLGYFGQGYLDVNLGAGNDTVTLSGLTVKGSGQVLSKGDLTLGLSSSTFQGNMDIGALTANIKVSNSKFTGWLRITTGQNTKLPDLDSFVINTCQIGGNFTVQTNANYHYLDLTGTTVGGSGSVSGKGGAKFISEGSTFQGGLTVDYQLTPAGSPAAWIQLTQTTVKGALAITTGAGDDTVTLNNDTIGQATPGAVATIDTGAGNDTVDLTGSTFYCNAQFDGGPGTDHLHKGGARFLALPPVILDFENVS